MDTDTTPLGTDTGTGTGARTEARTEAGAGADGITTTTVDGIRTVLAPGSGPLTAGLLFRVGRADETLAASGITHLVEHLALHRHGLGDLHYNGATAATHTHFHVTGTAADVVEYLNGVCAALRDLPMDRLETEKEILRTEAAGKSRGPAHAATLWRYGSRSYGLTSYAEAGLHHLTADQVRAWAQTRFTTENAVLWITGETVPEGLDLRLPAGAWQPAPEATSALPATPAYFHGEEGGVVLTAVLPRSTEAGLFADVLGKELFRELRQKGGYSYTATADYSPRDADTATITAYADALPEKQDALVGAFIDVFAKLRAGRIEQTDLDAVRASTLARFDLPELAARMLPGHAVNLLLRHRNLTVAEAKAEIEAVTVADLQRVARAVWADALMQVPGRGVDWAGLVAAPAQSPDVVDGRRFSAFEDGNVALLVAQDGVSLVSPRGRATVRYAECSLMQVYPDGARHLVGNDGFTVTVEPTLYRLTADALAPLDAGVPAGSVVRMPPRDPSCIPQPSGSVRADGPGRGAVWFTVLLWVLGVPGLLLGAWTLVLYKALGDAHSHMSRYDAQYVLKWLLAAAVFLVPWGICMERRRKGRN
ncbi:insulinase family protein [Streptomyces sp. NPDC044571]|uniref:M16 family metallopeptidase n=1 Tax=Streptomyces sp. NPDC044571 TaxID=3155371 RepID=UPI00340EE82C